MTDPLDSAPSGSAALSTPRAEPAQCPVPKGPRQVITRIAQIGFFFFLLKGLVWIAVAVIAWMGLSKG
jgi:hypothetical protein